MATRIRDLLEALDHRAPFASAAPWDAVGLQIGRPDAPLGGVAVVHELTGATIDACREAEVGTVVTYHPLVFRPLSSITDVPGPEGRALDLAQDGMAVVAIHTNWDVAVMGTADSLAAALGMDEVSSFGVTSDDDAFGDSISGRSNEPQIGRIGTFSGSGQDLVSRVATELGGVMRTAGMGAAAPRRVAVLPGAGGSFVRAAAGRGADVLVTGDVSHHEARTALDHRMAIVDPGHAATERPGVQALYDAVVEIAGSAQDFTSIDDSPWEGG